MIKFSRNSLLSPLAVFFIYILGAALVIMAFRFIYPGEAVPLACFTRSWRLIRFLLNYFSLFPALALSSLVIPFAITIHSERGINPFSARFLQLIKMSIITAIVAAAFYGLLLSLVLPLARDYEADLRFRGGLYRLAKEKAQEHAAAKDWAEAAQFVAVCESIWPEGPEIAKLKIETEIQVEEMLLSSGSIQDLKPDTAPAGGPQPLNAADALALGETAMAGERYFDAHWLATLAGRLAVKDSVEAAAATRLAGRAWSGINSLEPNSKETKAYNIFRLKREGHQALVTGEWIRAYYIFRELYELSPDDPDALKYLTMSEAGVRQTAFFLEEMEPVIGRILTGAIFSFPMGQGRLVMRVDSLSVFSDTAYGMGIDLMAFDRDGRPLWIIEAPYAKILPLVLDSGPAVTVLMRALDRNDKTNFREPIARGLGQSAPSGAQIALEVSWDNFLLLSNVRRGLSGLSPAALRSAAENLGSYGYQREVFEAELLRRFTEPLLLLPYGIFAIVMGWRYRASKRSLYIAVPMLGILPLVFNGALQIFRGWINNLGIWAVVSLGFSTAAVFFGAGIAVLLVLSLIILAAQHS